MLPRLRYNMNAPKPTRTSPARPTPSISTSSRVRPCSTVDEAPALVRSFLFAASFPTADFSSNAVASASAVKIAAAAAAAAASVAASVLSVVLFCLFTFSCVLLILILSSH